MVDEYGKIIELHKFYLELGTKASAGSLTVIGAILAYIGEHGALNGRMRLALTVPILLSAGNAIVFLMGTRLALDFFRQVKRAQLRLGAEWRPHVELLIWASVVAGLLFLLLTVGLVWIAARPEVWLPVPA
jgi:hypothetical protein